MAALATQSVVRAGVIPSYAACAGGGDTFLPGRNTFLHVKNASGGALTVTVVTPRTDQWGNAVADNAISVGAGAEKMIGPFPAESYADPSTGVANITYSGVTTLTIGVFDVSQP
ncbi:MAG: hypothetical protein V4703_12855 [Actinomycetota bacterium]